MAAGHSCTRPPFPQPSPASVLGWPCPPAGARRAAGVTPSQASITRMLPAPELASPPLTHNLVTPMFSGILILPHCLKICRNTPKPNIKGGRSPAVSCGEDPISPGWGTNARAYPLR